MKKMGIAALAGAFVLVSVGAGYAGPNVGGENFNIQARRIAADVANARAALYAEKGTPKTVSEWHWRTSNIGQRTTRQRSAVPIFKRVRAD